VRDSLVFLIGEIIQIIHQCVYVQVCFLAIFHQGFKFFWISNNLVIIICLFLQIVHLHSVFRDNCPVLKLLDIRYVLLLSSLRLTTHSILPFATSWSILTSLLARKSILKRPDSRTIIIVGLFSWSKFGPTITFFYGFFLVLTECKIVLVSISPMINLRLLVIAKCFLPI
jgi:hypothetical protein